MMPRESSVWRLIVCATPSDLLIELLLRLLFHPGERLPADFQHRLAEHWVKNA